MSLFDFQYFQALLRQNGYELVHMGNGTTYIRKRPFTRDSPTPAMERAQAAMTLASQSQIGIRGFSSDGLPQVADGNRSRIPQAMLFYRVTSADRRVQVAKEVASELGFDEEEKARLIELVRK